jgi:hypothetical protein
VELQLHLPAFIVFFFTGYYIFSFSLFLSFPEIAFFSISFSLFNTLDHFILGVPSFVPFFPIRQLLLLLSFLFYNTLDHFIQGKRNNSNLAPMFISKPSGLAAAAAAEHYRNGSGECKYRHV